MEYINSIFHFPDSLTLSQYRRMWRDKEISDKTIVFAGEQKAIYKNGEQYGVTDAEDLQKASKQNYGVVKIGTGIDVDDAGIISVTLTKGDKGDKGEKGDKGDKGDAGTEITYDDTQLRNSVAQLNTLIGQLDSNLDDANATATTEYAKLANLINSLDQSILTKVESLFDTADWVHSHVDGKAVSSSTFGDDDVEDYLLRIGVWARDGENNITKTQWSQLQLSVNSISADVTELKEASGDPSALEALLASLEAYVDEELGAAVTTIDSTYAKTTDLDGYTKDDDIKSIVEWLYSGLKSSSSSNMTYAQLVSAGKNNTLGTNAISEVQTAINNLGDTYVSNSSIESKVNDAISGLYNSATDNNAKTLIFSKIAANTADIASNSADILSNSQDIAAIVTNATGDSTNATIATKFANWKAGLITTNNLSSSIASLLTSGDATSAGLMLKSTWDSAQSSLITTSNINNYTSCFLNETQVGNIVDGKVATATATMVAKNDFTAAAIVAMVNDAASTVLISSDHLNIGSDYILAKLGTGSIEFSKLNITGTDITGALGNEKIPYGNLNISSANLISTLGSASITTDKIDINGLSSNSTLINAINSQLTVNTVTATNGTGTTTISPTDGIKLVISNNTTNWLKQDGSGSLATGNISWDGLGSVNIKGNIEAGGSNGYTAKVTTANDKGVFIITDDPLGQSNPELMLTATVPLGGEIILKDPTGETATNDILPQSIWMSNSDAFIRLNNYTNKALLIVTNNPNSDAKVELSASTTDGTAIYVGDQYGATGYLKPSGAGTSSDITLKDVIDDKVIDILDIAHAPLFRFTWKTFGEQEPLEDKEILVGTSAQYWLNVIPEAVNVINNKLALNYSTIATASAITAAREIVKLKEENETLKSELADIKSRLQALENA